MQELRETAAVSRQDRRESHVLFIPRTECGRVSVVPAAYAVMCFVNVVTAALSTSHPVVSPTLIHSPQFTQPLFLLPKTETLSVSLHVFFHGPCDHILENTIHRRHACNHSRDVVSCQPSGVSGTYGAAVCSRSLRTIGQRHEEEGGWCAAGPERWQEC